MAADPHNKPADLGCHLYVCLWAAAIQFLCSCFWLGRMSPKYDLFLCRVVCKALMNPRISRVSHIAVRHVATGPLWPANGQRIRGVVDVYSWKAACNNCMHLTTDRFLQRIVSLGILLCMIMMLDIFMHFGTWNAGHKNQFLVLKWCFKFSFSGRTVNLSHTVYAVSLAVNTEHNAGCTHGLACNF